MGECMLIRRAGEFAVPDGMTMTPVNSAENWVKCAGLSYGSLGSPSLAQIVADSGLCASLMNSQNAVNYLLRSPTIQTAVLGSTTAIAALDASSPIVSPVMSANSQSGYIASASRNNDTAYMATLTQMSAASCWWGDNTTWEDAEWVQLQAPASVFAYKYKVWLDANNTGVRNCKLQASVDGATWVDVTAAVAVSGPTALLTYTGITGVYKYFRALGVTATMSGGAYPATGVGHLQIYGKKAEAIA